MLLIQNAPVAAEAPPYIDFIRGLRNEGLPDLALEYIRKIRPSAPADILDDLSLEYARTMMELAGVELDEGKRSLLLSQARAEFDSFLKKNANHPEANVELAKLTSYLARSQLLKSRRSEDEVSKNTEAEKARPMFENAATRFQKSTKLLDEEIKKVRAEKKGTWQARIRLLQDAQAKSHLDEMINLYNISETYLRNDQKDLLAKANALKKARSGFSAIYESNEVVDRTGWIAAAWYYHISVLMNEPQVALKTYETLLKNRPDPLASDGVRLVRYFKIRDTFEGRDDGSKAAGDVLLNTLTMASSWLKDYGSFRNTPEGLGIRFIQGICYQNLADKENGIRRDKNNKVLSITPAANTNLQEALHIYKELTDLDNEYYDKSSRRKQEILLLLADSEGKAGEVQPSSINSFDKAVIQAQIQEARLLVFLRKQEDRSSPEGKKRVADEEKLRIGKAISYLERALQIVSPKDSTRDVFDARYFLTRCYLYGGQPMSAAVYGENLARNNLRLPKAASACSLAVQGYNRSAAEAIASGEAGKTLAEVDIERLKKLAQYMDVTWPDDTATDDARELWAYYTARDKKYTEAISIYQKIRPNYAGIYLARLQQGGSLFSLIREDVESSRLKAFVPGQIKKYSSYWNDTLTSLRNLPEPNPNLDSTEASHYFLARMQLCQLLMLEGKEYAEIQKIADAAQKLLATSASFTNKNAEKNELLYSIKAMHLNGIQGQIATLIQEGNQSKVSELIKAPLQEIQKEINERADPKNKEKLTALEAVPTFDRYTRGERDILIIALRAAIQENKLEDANGLLNTLEKSGGSVESRVANLRSLVGTVRTQFESLRKAGKAEEEKQLVEGFSKFLDQIASQPKLPTTMTLFLAQGYASIDLNAKSVELLENLLKSLPEPTGNDPSDTKTKTYRQIQYTLAKTYRQAKNYEKAKEYLEKLIGTGQAKGPFFSSIEARKERAYLYEDQGDFRNGVAYWTTMARMFGEPLPPPNPKNDSDARKRSLYFDLFFEAQRCSAKAYNSLDKNKSAKQIDDGFGKIAQRFYDMENKNPDLSTTLKDKMRDLMEENKILQDKYKALGGKLLETSN